MQKLWTTIASVLERGESVTLSTVLRGPRPGAAGVYSPAGRLLSGTDVGFSSADGLLTQADETLFVDTLQPRPGLVIFGGGHVAVPVAKIGKLVDFEVIVNDDRPEFASPDRFPEADQVLAMGHDQAFTELKLNSRHYIVIVTRGHVHDRDCLVRALESQASYIGVIGSKKKAADMNQWLIAQGYGEKDIRRIFSPIGLDINARTPEEIAVSIMAEVIRERSRRPAPANLDAIAAAIQAKPSGETWALATIVASFGSTPRGPGARMLVKAGGAGVGSVGGGVCEKEAESIAMEVIMTGTPRLADFHMDNELAAETGAVCGGSMTVFIQPVD